MPTILNGTPQADSLKGEDGVFENIIYGFEGDDRLTGGSDAENRLFGGEGNDLLTGGGLRDYLYGGTGDDTLRGQLSQSARLYGQDGNDDLIGAKYASNVLDGGSGIDRMRGGFLHDTYVVDRVGDMIDESYGGIDTVRSFISFSLKADLENLVLLGTARTGNGNAGTNKITGNNVANVLNGFAGDDALFGKGGNDILKGGSGHNRLSGGDGNDTLQGGNGNDVLLGGRGQDRITTGEGYDNIVFDTKPGLGADEIRDFNPYADKISLKRSEFTMLGSARQVQAEAFTLGTKAADASDRLIYDRASGLLYYDPDGTGSQAKVAVAQFVGSIDLSHHAFWVI